MPDPTSPTDGASASEHPEGPAAEPVPAEKEPKAPGPAAERVPAEKKPKAPGPTAVVRYGMTRHIGEFRHNLDGPPSPGTKAVVRTGRGVELGEVVTAVCAGRRLGCITAERLVEFVRASGPEYPFRRGGRLLRLANPQDIIDHRHLESSAREEAAYCRDQIRQLELKMRLVTVEHLLGGERIIFYFSAESRVDFRELVRRLAGQYRTRIEMRQVGARDEARLVADFERCGQRCCCQEFLKHLKPVSMRMAKMQKATLDPSKISGRCGRLMCCLRYEDESYEFLRAKLPKKNTWVRTEEYFGRVTDTQILTQLVCITMPDASHAVVGNERIIERDLEPPALPKTAPAEAAPAGLPAASEPLLLRDEPAAEPVAVVGLSGQGRRGAEPPPKEPEPAPAESPGDSPSQVPGAGRESRMQDRKPKRRRRRRRPKKKPGGAGGPRSESPQAQGQKAPGGPSARKADPPRPKRRRRKKRRR